MMLFSGSSCIQHDLADRHLGDTEMSSLRLKMTWCHGKSRGSRIFTQGLVLALLPTCLCQASPLHTDCGKLEWQIRQPTTLGFTVAGNVKVFPMLSDYRQEPVFSPSFGLMKFKNLKFTSVRISINYHREILEPPAAFPSPSLGSLKRFCKEDLPTYLP